jgi:hypothetical protein
MFRCVALFVLALLALPAPAHAQSSVAPDIVLVRVAGPWQTAAGGGISRLVARSGGGAVALAVEWISDSGQVVQSMPVAAPPGSENLPLARIRNDSGTADSAVYFDTPDGNTFTLIVGPPGEARFGAASN